MDPNKNIEDITLEKWLAGELSGEELTRFEASDAFKSYKAILDISENLELSSYDTENELTRLQESIANKKQGKVVTMSPLKKWSIAAGIALIIGMGSLWMTFNNTPTEVSYLTEQQEIKTIDLPDASTVSLNIASNLEYDGDNWQNNRIVKLSGEAYFKVEKGKKFSVQTNHGTIAVLGTEFNIRNRGDYTEVICYEGKVSVTDLAGNDVILTQKQGTRIEEGALNTNWKPVINDDADWKKGVSSFYDVPLKNVIEELENQYGIKVQYDFELPEQPYHTYFPHDNLENALQMVFTPKQLKYELTGNNVMLTQ